MKVKGEFEKQLKELLFLQFDVDGGHSAQKKFLSIVDEARKEFPRERTFFAGEKIEDTWVRLSTKRQEWFKKWFGVEK